MAAGEHQVLESKLNSCELDDNLTNIINPNDVVFAVSETKCGSLACSDIDLIPGSDSGTSALATCLDLSDLRHMHGKTLKGADILNSIGAKCCKQQKPSIQYKELIQNLMEKNNVNPSCSKNAPQQQLHKLRSDLQMKLGGCASESKCSSSSSTDSSQSFYCISDESASEDNIMRQKYRLKKESSKRCCPLCHANITWLPKFAACPKCGFRSLLNKVEKKPYDHTLTANDILQEYAEGKFMQQASDVSTKNSQQKFPCRCSCTNDKTCAHCRIKQLCQNIFQPNQKREDDCDKCETKSSDLYNICKTKSQTCRPYLMKVFDGLKDIFDVTEGKKNSAVENNLLNTISKNGADRNSSELQKVDKNTNTNESAEKNLNEQRKKFLVKNFQAHKACKNKSLYHDNSAQRKYPVSKMGHKTCLAGRKIVPRNMGWLWNAETNASRIGWMPGAIRKPIKNLMLHFLRKDELCPTRQIHKDDGNGEKDYTKEATLHVCKKDGAYYITLRPLRAIGTNLKPIQFKITKNPYLAELRQLKQHLKEMGFPKCVCHQPISLCCCRNLPEKEKLVLQCCKECRNRELPNCLDNLILSDTTDSETEFEFGVTPPAGVPQPGACFKKRKKVNSGTQYQEGDWKIKPKYPKPLAKYLKLHNCAIGNRFGKAFGPYGKKGFGPGAFPVDGIYGPGGVMPLGMKGKGGRGIDFKSSDRFRGPDGKFNMAKYLEYKTLTQPSKEEMAKRKRQKMELLKGVNPPLLCKVDRRRKPIDICSTYFPCNAACLSDDRIC